MLDLESFYIQKSAIMALLNYFNRHNGALWFDFHFGITIENELENENKLLKIGGHYDELSKI